VIKLLTLLKNDRVTLTLTASIEQYQLAIQASQGTIIILETDSQRQYLSTDKALDYLKKEANNVKSISFESLLSLKKFAQITHE
jgi:hypothetical protein